MASAEALKVKWLRPRQDSCQEAVSHRLTPPRDWHPINFGALRRCPPKQGSGVGSRRGPLCQPSLFPLLPASAPGPPVIDSSPIKSEERLTCDLKLSLPQPRPPPPPHHLHANSVFTENAPPPLAMNSGGEGPASGPIITCQQNRERGEAQHGDNIGRTLDKRSREAQAFAENKDLVF
ncbi:hypothetical protein PBY51_009281 [Eleginops maclovinus]|uniref:Uncharacterized protein n=1 Tax=Eleginops maclovinus TaxID=56733 RepID=A0AAN7XTS0_ELEMC|nr:hypothetical protein PBY51_009281 [Eleginops maclovinus]